MKRPPTVLALPFPPSVNAMWRYGRERVYKSKSYAAWIEAADAAMMTTRPKPKPVHGHFTIDLSLPATKRGRSDVDNRLKAILDWLQRVELIDNDRFCDEAAVSWADTTECRVTISPAKDA